MPFVCELSTIHYFNYLHLSIYSLISIFVQTYTRHVCCELSLIWTIFKIILYVQISSQITFPDYIHQLWRYKIFTDIILLEQCSKLYQQKWNNWSNERPYLLTAAYPDKWFSALISKWGIYWQPDVTVKASEACPANDLHKE